MMKRCLSVLLSFILLLSLLPASAEEPAWADILTGRRWISDGGNSLMLNADGTGSWEDAQTGSYDIVEWTADGETVSVTLPDRTIPGTVRNGLVCMNDADMFCFYAQDGADPSLFGAITPDEATVVTGIDYYFGIRPEGYDVDKAISCFQASSTAKRRQNWTFPSISSAFSSRTAARFPWIG